KAVAGNEARAAEREVEVTEHAAACHLPAPMLELVEMAGRVKAANDSANRGAGDHGRLDAVGHQSAQHADMGKAARRAAAERKADRQPVLGTRTNHSLAVKIAVRMSSQHGAV